MVLRIKKCRSKHKNKGNFTTFGNFSEVRNYHKTQKKGAHARQISIWPRVNIWFMFFYSGLHHINFEVFPKLGNIVENHKDWPEASRRAKPQLGHQGHHTSCKLGRTAILATTSGILAVSPAAIYRPEFALTIIITFTIWCHHLSRLGVRATDHPNPIHSSDRRP